MYTAIDRCCNLGKDSRSFRKLWSCVMLYISKNRFNSSREGNNPISLDRQRIQASISFNSVPTLKHIRHLILPYHKITRNKKDITKVLYDTSLLWLSPLLVTLLALYEIYSLSSALTPVFCADCTAFSSLGLLIMSPTLAHSNTWVSSSLLCALRFAFARAVHPSSSLLSFDL